MKINKYVFDKRFATYILFIIMGIYIMFDPGMTEWKFGYGYPWNIVTGAMYVVICTILLILSYKKLL